MPCLGSHLGSTGWHDIVGVGRWHDVGVRHSGGRVSAAWRRSRAGTAMCWHVYGCWARVGTTGCAWHGTSARSARLTTARRGRTLARRGASAAQQWQGGHDVEACLVRQGAMPSRLWPLGPCWHNRSCPAWHVGPISPFGLVKGLIFDKSDHFFGCWGFLK